MKKLLPIFGLLLISNLCISQVSVGVDYVLNNDMGRKYSNSLSGFDINLKYFLTDRFNVSSSLVLYGNYKTSQITYKNWGVDLNGEINILKRNILNLYGILGVGFLQESVIPRGIIIDPNNGLDLKKRVFLLNVGLGSHFKITKNVWIKLNILSNSSYEFIIIPGLLYHFKIGI
jgi:hypothetical protein